MNPFVTIDILVKKFKDYLQSKSSQIDAYSPQTIWDILANTYSMMMLDLYANLNNVRDHSFIQNYVGDQCDIGLYQNGLSARVGQTYGYVIVTFSAQYTIPANTTFQSVTGQVYQNLIIFTDTSSTSNQYILYAITAGGTTYVTPATILTNSNDNTMTCVVKSCIIGQDIESDQSCIARLLLSKRSTISGARQSDYTYFVMESNSILPVPIITGSIIQPNFISYNGQKQLGVFALTGSQITEYQLNLGLLTGTTFQQYDRSANDDTILAVSNYIDNQKMINTFPIIGTSYTWIVNQDTDVEHESYHNININVSLAFGFSLDTIISIQSQDISLNPISIDLTVTQLIKRSFRYAICLQSYGGTSLQDGSNIIPASNILATMLNQLGVNGIVAQFLLNAELSFVELLVPNYSYDVANLYWIYDIKDYSLLTIGLL